MFYYLSKYSLVEKLKISQQEKYQNLKLFKLL